MTETIRFAFGSSALGRFIAACSDRGLVRFEFADTEDAAETLRARFAGAPVVEDAAGMAGTVAALAAAVADPARDVGLALDPRGSEYELRVWDALRQVPAGRTVTYGEIAARLGAPREAREVGEACAANRIAILIPCHRVVRKDGTLAGYRWGYRRKRALLAREQGEFALVPA